MDSIREYRTPPVTFGGDFPEFASGEAHAHAQNRLVIGGRCQVPGADGVVHIGQITSLTIAEAETKVHASVLLDDGSTVICTSPISEVQLKAWQNHPDTFFGRLERKQEEIEDPLELYDFFLRGYESIPAPRLLEMLTSAPDYHRLRQLTQPKLASICAERRTNDALNAMQIPAGPSR